MIYWLRSVLLLFLTATAFAPGVTQAQTNQRCFAETGFCISGRIREFWEQNGGLRIFGLPIDSQQQQIIEGQAIQVQNFERNRLELHPEYKRPYDVLLGRLGADRLAQIGTDWQAYPKSGPQAKCRFFPETGQSICGPILRAWQANGIELDRKAGKSDAEHLALFGMPLSPLILEMQADGQERQVQWFERARFEIHSENQPPNNVLLGLLGSEIRTNTQPNVPAETHPGLPAAQNAIVTPERGPRGTNFKVLASGFTPGEQIGVYITAPDRSVFGARFQETADQRGQSGPVAFTSGILNPNYGIGIWAMTFEGVVSGHKGIGYFEVTR
jgi:hypothetical protein